MGLDAGAGCGGDGESVWFQAWRRGDGIAGAVGFEGRLLVRIRGVLGGARPFEREEAEGAADGLVLRAEEPDGPAVVDVDADDVAWARCDAELSASCPTLRLFLSVVDVSVVNFILMGMDLEVPNPGDWYRVRGRALPAPCQRYTPFGFLDNDFPDGCVCALPPFKAGAEVLAPMNVILGEVPRAGVVIGLGENRKGSGCSSGGRQMSAARRHTNSIPLTVDASLKKRHKSRYLHIIQCPVTMLSKIAGYPLNIGSRCAVIVARDRGGSWWGSMFGLGLWRRYFYDGRLNIRIHLFFNILRFIHLSVLELWMTCEHQLRLREEVNNSHRTLLLRRHCLHRRCTIVGWNS